MVFNLSVHIFALGYFLINFNKTCPIKTKLSVYDRVSIIYFKFLYKKSGRPGLESIKWDHVFINKEIDQPFLACGVCHFGREERAVAWTLQQ